MRRRAEPGFPEKRSNTAQESSVGPDDRNTPAAKKSKSDRLLSRFFPVAAALHQARRAAVGLGEHVHVAVECADGHTQQFNEMLAIANAAFEKRFELHAAGETMTAAVVFVVHGFCLRIVELAPSDPLSRKNDQKPDKYLGIVFRLFSGGGWGAHSRRDKDTGIISLRQASRAMMAPTVAGILRARSSATTNGKERC
jgi:hypothetical protein